jgi:drug/metabolite transporter (DMT)-like permease
MYVMVVVILAVVVMHEPLTIKKVLGVLSAVTAIILLS